MRIGAGTGKYDGDRFGRHEGSGGFALDRTDAHLLEHAFLDRAAGHASGYVGVLGFASHFAEDDVLFGSPGVLLDADDFDGDGFGVGALEDGPGSGLLGKAAIGRRRLAGRERIVVVRRDGRQCHTGIELSRGGGKIRKPEVLPGFSVGTSSDKPNGPFR